MSTSVLAFISRYRHYTILFLSVFGFLSFGLYHLGSFITADEHYWVEERIPEYWEAWEDGSPKKTFINDKPGVSLALVSGSALPFFDKTVLKCQYEEGRFQNCDPDKTAGLYQAFRLPILILNAILLIALFFSIRAFSSLFVANATVFFAAFSPHLIGMSQIINPDALLWSTGSVALFSFIALLKTGKLRFLFLSALTLGLALLSKYVALIIIFFLPVLLLIIYFTEKDFSPLHLKRQILVLLTTSASAIAVFLLLAPGVFLSDHAKLRFIDYFTAGTESILPWIGYIALIGCLTALAFFKIPKNIASFLAYTANIVLRTGGVLFFFSSLTLIIARIAFPEWIPLSTIPNDIKDLTNARYYLGGRFLTPFEISMVELSALIYSIPIISLFLAFVDIFMTTFVWKNRFRPIPLSILFFIIINLAILGFSNVFAVSRYVVLLFPMIAYLAALGFAEILSRIPHRWLKFSLHAKSIIFIGVGTLSLASLISSTPYYTNFSNSLLPDGAVQDHSWGYGGYEAAKYLNTLPDAKNITVWADYYGVCEFFVGKCLTSYDFNKTTIQPDYYVLTRRGKHRYSSRADRWEERSGLFAYKYYDRSDYIWGIDINGNTENFVRVFKTDSH